MPKLNPVGIIVASIAFYIVGFLWYGVIFSDAWMAAQGLTPEDAKGESPAWMALGFVITVMQVIGLAMVLKWKGDTALTAAATTAAILCVLIAVPMALYDYIYLPRHDATLTMIDASHLLVGWVVSAAILTRFK